MREIVFATEVECHVCGELVDQSLRRGPMARSVDHVVPISAGGLSYRRDNLRLAHQRCNAARGGALPAAAEEIAALRARIADLEMQLDGRVF